MRDGTGLATRSLVAVVLAASLLAWLVPLLPPVRALALGLDDLFIALLTPAAPQHPAIALVTIGEDSLEGAICRSPLDRELLAGLVETLDRAGVRAIGLDVLFDQKTTDAADRRLHDALRATHAPLVAITAEAGTGMTERQRAWHEDFLAGLPTGYANLAKDRIDGAVRWQLPLEAGRPSFPEALAALALGREPAAAPSEIAWHGRPSAEAAPFPTYPAETVDLLPPAWLAGRIVLVGTALAGVDRHRTPLSLVEGDTPGVEIQAHVLAQLMDGRRLARLPAWAAPALVPLAALGGALLAAAGLGLAAQLALAVLVPLALLGVTAATYAAGGPLFWPLPPALAWLLAQALATAQLVVRERTDRRLVMRLFANHVSAPIAAGIWDARATFLAGGRPRPQTLTATVLFSDIEGSTTVAEALGPEAVMGWLESYLDRMVGIVDRHGGVVLRFIGDGLFAGFGVPVPRADEAAIDQDARNAVACALAMADALEGLNAELSAQGLPRLAVRIGIQTGRMTAGSLGRAEHLEYALMGDAVNTGARLEAFAKTLRGPHSPLCTIVVGEATAARLDPETPLRPVGELALRGKESRVAAYEILLKRESAHSHNPR